MSAVAAIGVRTLVPLAIIAGIIVFVAVVSQRRLRRRRERGE